MHNNVIWIFLTPRQHASIRKRCHGEVCQDKKECDADAWRESKRHVLSEPRTPARQEKNGVVLTITEECSLIANSVPCDMDCRSIIEGTITNTPLKF